jgi:hypothetical protein
MKTMIVRVAEGKDTTLSHLYIAGTFCCYLLEDKIREEKIPGQTCIPEGNYKLRLNKYAGMNTRYKRQFPAIHQGMLEIGNIQLFDQVFIHIGNFHDDTAGCPLAGHYWQLVNGDYQVMQSTFAYSRLYPKLVEQIRRGNTEIEVVNSIRELVSQE